MSLPGLSTRTSLLLPAFFALLLAVLFLGWHAGFGWFVVPVFILFNAVVYFFLLPERKILRSSFWLLIGLSIISTWLLGPHALKIISLPVIVLLTALFFGTIFGIILGLVYFKFSERFLVYDILNTAVFAVIFLVFLSLGTPYFLGWVAPALFLASALNFKEAFSLRGVIKNKGWLHFGS